MSSNKTIAKNTILLYFRMIFTMLVSLFTSRVVLEKLGVEDYGIYQVVGGVVGMLSFLNGALSTGSSRFLTFALGKNDKEDLSKTFSTTLSIHIVLALIIVFLAETIGLWFFHNKLEIPDNRVFAASAAYHLSIVTSFISITQVPYGAVIIAREKMDIYAYMSIVDVVLKLVIVYLLSISPWDKLIFYASLICVIQIGIALFYRIYCVNNFEESKYKFVYDKNILKEISKFSGWSLFANFAIALNAQGMTIITNMFFNPSVVAARAISLQVNTAAMQLVGNFRTAVNPQIVKRYAAGDEIGSRNLLLASTKYSFFLMYIVSVPIILLAQPLLQIWLGQVPEYSVIFLQLVVIESLFSIFDSSLYMALYAKGQLKQNALISPLVGFIRFPIVYYMFKNGCSPVVLSWVGIISYAVLGVIIKPILIHRIVNYPIKEIMKLFIDCIKVVILTLPIIYVINFIVNKFSFNLYIYFLITSIYSVFIIGFITFYFGVSKEIRKKLIMLVSSKIKLLNNR